MSTRFRLTVMVVLAGAVWSGTLRLGLSQESDSRLDAKLDAALNAQVNAELHSAYLCLSHAKHISKLIANLVQQSRQAGDTATETFLQWFVTEQVEEEANTYRIAQQLKLAGDERTALLLLDRELAQRMLAPAAPAAPPPAVP
jgi:ferritin